MIFHVLVAMLAGWLQRHQQQVITYLLEENRVLKAQLGGRRLSLADPVSQRKSSSWSSAWPKRMPPGVIDASRVP
jgi:hypothetical protein